MHLHQTITESSILIACAVLLVVAVLLLYTKQEPWRNVFTRKKIALALLVTAIGLLYYESGFSGTYAFTRYGFPRQLFEMYHILPAFEKGVDVRVYSTMHWDHLLENTVLIYLLFVNIDLLVTK